MKKLSAIIFVLLFAVPEFAQQNSGAILVDEFGNVTCEDLLARTDNLGIKLLASPDQRAFVILSGTGNAGKRADSFSKFVHRALIGRFGLEFHVTILRDKRQNEFGGKIWLIPEGNSFDTSNLESVEEIPFRIRKRTLYDTETGDVCETWAATGFTRILKADSKLTGYIVEVNYSLSERRRSIQDWGRFLKENGLESMGLRLYFRRNKHTYNSIPFREYWLIPKKQKR